jgi:parallel beta-helix repeat protein
MYRIPILMLSVLAMTQLINISYFHGLESDFSNLVLQAFDGNNTNYTMVSKEDGGWALVNATNSSSFNVLSRGPGTYSQEKDPKIVDVGFFDGLEPDFSNLVISIVSVDGTSYLMGFSIISKENGKWAIIGLDEAPLAGQSIELLASHDTIQPSSSPTSQSVGQIDALGPSEPYSIDIKDHEGKKITAESNGRKNGGKHQVTVVPNGLTIKKVVFQDLAGSGSLRLDDVPSGSVPSNGTSWLKVYAIDPSSLNFTSATVYVVATGNSLFKCKSWDFASRSCAGDWVLIRTDLVPGKEYGFELTPEDPGFGEKNISIIDVQSYPSVGGNWTVRFTTTGTANLTITAVNGTTWDDSDIGTDLNFVELRCGDISLSPVWDDSSKTVLYENYFCSDTGYETSKVITPGEHHLEFRFGEDVGYANNDANLNDCAEITTGGTYTLTADISGSPYSASPVTGNACVKITSSNVIFDCDGFKITDGGSGTTTGVVISGPASNITIKDCAEISNYSYAIYAYDADNISILNNTIVWDGFGIMLDSTDNSIVEGNQITNCTSEDSLSAGISALASSSYNLVSGNSLAFNEVGIEVDSLSEHNNISGNNVNDSQYYGVHMDGDYGVISGNSLLRNSNESGYYQISLDFGDYCLVTGNSVADGPQGGIYVYASFNNVTYNLASNDSVGIMLMNPGSNNTVIGNNVSGNYNGIFIDSSQYNTLVENNATGNTEAFDVWNAPNNRLINNSASGQTGFTLYGSSGTLLANNTACDNSQDAILLESSASSNNLTGNTACNSAFGFYIRLGSNNNTLTGNTAYGNTYGGFDVWTSSNNTLLNNTAYGNTDGFLLSSSTYNTLVNNSAYSNTFGFYLWNGTYNALANNTASDSTWSGFYLQDGSSYNNLTSNNAYDNGYAGFDVNNASGYNLLTGNTARGGSSAAIQLRDNSNHNTLVNNSAYYGSQGFSVWQSSYNLLVNNTAYNSSTWDGFHLTDGATYNNLTGNIARDNTWSGFDAINGCDYNIFTGNIAWGNPWAGIELRDNSDFNTLINNTASNGTGVGFFLWNGASYNNLTNNTAYNNGQAGVYVQDSNYTLIIGDHYYNNTPDFKAEDTGGQAHEINLSGVVFDSAPGAYQNFTNLSLNDTVTALSAYTIGWSANSSPLQSGHTSFGQKFVNISTLSGAPSIDSIAWNWQDSELSGYNESKFQLWKYDSGGWSKKNAVLNAGANTLNISNLNPASTYAILENNASENCPVINTSFTTYTQTQNFAGAPNSASPLSGTACVLIAASNVVFDCNGYNITGADNSTTTYAILLNGSLSNVTVRNCPGLSNCTYGLYSYRSLNSAFTNNTASNNSKDGFMLASTNNSNISNNFAFNNTEVGFDMTGRNNTISFNSANGNLQNGFLLTSGSNNTIFNNTASDTANICFLLFSNSNGNAVNNNSAYRCQVGISLSNNANGNNLSGNYAYNNTARGIVVSSSSNNRLSGNVAYNNSNYGYYVLFSSNNTLSGNSGSNNTEHGFYVYGSNDTVLSNNTAFNNSLYGFYVYISSNTGISDNTAMNNSNIGMHISSSNGTVVSRDHYFANGRGLAVHETEGVPFELRLSNVVFDSPGGAFQNFTNLSLNDTVSVSSIYTITWSSSGTPANLTSFNGKFVNLSGNLSTIKIESIVWSWLDSESAGYNETKLELWQYNSTSQWKLMNRTADASANTLSLTNLTPESIYGILSDEAGPNIIWYNQTPPDIDSLNVVSIGANITYNMTDPSGIDPNSPILYYKTNTSSSDCWTFVNGSYGSCGYQPRNFTSNLSELWLWRLFDNQVYPATYNLNETAMENTTHSSYSMGTQNDPIKIELLNVSATRQYGFFEVMANVSSGTAPLRFYYCNSSYTTGNPSSSSFCTNFYSLAYNTGYNHSHSAFSLHMVAPFAMNATSGLLGTVKVTSTSYFILRPAQGSAWSAYYIPNVTRASAMQTSNTNGNSWSNLAGTVDAHLHQYDGTDRLWYYACANDTLNNSACSVARFDYLNLSGIPPTAPDVFSPTNGTTCGNFTINYTAAISPNGYNISYYNISLMNSDFSLNKTIIGNNSQNLSYVWNASGTSPGNYSIRVVACDTLGQCSSGFSLLFNYTGACTVNCPVITSPGVFNMTMNYTGSPNNASPLSNFTCVKIASSDVVFDCKGFIITNNGTSGTTYGILLNGSLTNVTVKNCPMVGGYTNGVYIYQSNNSLISNNTAYNSSNYGFVLNSSANNSVTNNTATANLQQGFRVISSPNNTFSFNNASNNTNNSFYIDRSSNTIFANNFASYPVATVDCVRFLNSNYNIISNNTVTGSTSNGLRLDNSSYNNLTSNNVTNSTQHGFRMLANSSYNNYVNNSASFNARNGFSNDAGIFDLFANNTAFGNLNNGLQFGPNSNHSIAINNTAYNNSQSGYYVMDTVNLTITGGHLYSNGLDLRVNSSVATFNSSLNVGGLIFDSPLGLYQNYTNLSFNDTILSNTGFGMNWTANESALPPGKLSFAQKFVNITTLNGSISLDGISWSWLDSELTGYNESKFELWKYNSSGWANMNATLNVGANTLNLTNFVPGSDYGILEQNDTTPPSIKLNYPANGTSFATSTVYFSWNATDDFSASMLCNLTINGSVNASNILSPNNTDANLSVSGFSTGNFSWNVTCVDESGNVNTSETRNFTILPSANLSPVDLGIAANYVILAGSAITGAINTHLIGDVGLSPTGGAAITLLQCGGVNGIIYDTDGGYAGGGGNDTSCRLTNASLLTQAKNDLNTAYNDAAARAPTTIYGPIYDLGGQTLIPGVYSDPTSFGITGNLTLDAQGNTSAVFIFQAGSTLITATGSKVVLINGAQASNVFWQVGSSATLGTNSIFKGNILALTAITLNSGTNVTGRLLAQNSFVTLADNNVTLPSDGPFITFVPPTDNSSAVVNRPYILANVTATDIISLDNITIYLYNSTGGLVNSSNSTTSPLFANFTGLPGGLYYFNATACDAAGSCNSTETRNVTITTGCPIITSPGVYTQTMNYTGAPNDASPLSNFTCVKIASSNVVFDCAGFNITDNGTSGTTYGILLNGSLTNVTVKNCPNISGYYNGVYSLTSSNATFSNLSIYNAFNGVELNASNSSSISSVQTRVDNTGFNLDTSSYNTLTDTAALGNGAKGYYIYSGSGNRIFNGTADSGIDGGFILSSTTNNTIANCTAYNIGGAFSASGFSLESATNNLLENNTAYNATVAGFSLYPSSGSNVLNNNLAYNNSLAGFRLGSGDSNNLSRNIAYNNTYYGFLVNSNQNILDNNTAFDNLDIGLTGAGFYVNGSSGNNLSNNNATNNPHGFKVESGNSNILRNNNATSNTYSGFFLLGADVNSLANNTASGSSDCFYVNGGSSTNTLSNNLAYVCTNGFHVYSNNNDTDSNNLWNNTAFSNSNGFNIDGSTSTALSPHYTDVANNTAYGNNNGFYVLYASLNSLSGNNATNNSIGFFVSNSWTDSLSRNIAYNNTNSGFYIGNSGSGINLTNNTAYDNFNGIYVLSSGSNNIVDNTLYGNNYGVYMFTSSQYNQFTGNNASANNIGFLLMTGSLLNTFTNNTACSELADAGFYLNTGSGNNTFINNTACNDNKGFYLTSSTYNRLISNVVANDSSGVYLDPGSNFNSLEGNSVTGNPGQAIYIYSSQSNNLTYNSVNTSGTGIRLHTSTGNRIVNNISSDGIKLENSSSSNTIAGNTVFANAGSGITVGELSNTNNVSGNAIRANDNGISLNNVTANTVRSNNVSGNTNSGITLQNNARTTTIAGNNVSWNGIAGILVDGSPQNSLSNNSVFSNNPANSTFGGLMLGGIILYINSTNTTLSNNTVWNNSQYGIGIWSSDSAIATANTIYGQQLGYYIVNSSNGRFRNDTITNNTQYGMFMQDNNNTRINGASIINNSYGIYLNNSDTANLSFNNITNNSIDGIRMDAASGAGLLYSDFVCYNGLDINNQGSPNTGSGDRCDSFLSWSENGHKGCEFSCSSMWHRFFGNVNGTLVLRDNTSSNLFFGWNATGFNVYFIDYDSQIDWTSLQAIGRTSSNTSSSDDFTELDSAFSTAAFSDNINRTYSTDGSAPIATQGFTVFGRPVNLVPVSDSTVSGTVFKTGILWDMSDGGTEYGGSQSTAWIVKVNAATPDAYGTYDYLIQVPYTLSTREGTNDVVAVYLELQ